MVLKQPLVTPPLVAPCRCVEGVLGLYLYLS